MARANTEDTTNLSGLAQQQAVRVQAVTSLKNLRREARAEINRLLDLLDQSDSYVMTELEDDDDREEVGDTEPSLGSLDRAANKERWSQGNRWETDAEVDDCDRERPERGQGSTSRDGRRGMNVDADDVDIKLHEIASMIEFALRAFGEEDNYENRNLVDFALRSRPASDCSSRQHLAQGKGERP